jgi:hypothetical protein
MLQLWRGVSAIISYAPHAVHQIVETFGAPSQYTFDPQKWDMLRNDPKA